MDCLFCKIVNKKIPSYKVYEDDFVLAFLDITPVSPGHTLVIPKKHFSNLEDVDSDNLSAAIQVVKKVGKALKFGMGYEGYNVLVNNDPVSGQIIPHLHFHVIPRVEGDNLKFWPQSKYSEGEAEKTLKKLQDGI